MSRRKTAANLGGACALLCVSLWGQNARADDPAPEPASDPLADEDAGDSSEIDDSPAQEPPPAAEEPAPTQDPPAAAEEPAPAPPAQQPPPAAAEPTTSKASGAPSAASAEDEDFYDEISYDQELANFVASGAGVGSSYDRAHATTADENIREVDDDSADLYEVKSEKRKQGFGFQVRRSRLSKRMQEIFVERSPGPADQNGFGLNYLNRSQAVAFSVGLGYDPLNGTDGYYVERGGKATSAGDVDYVEFRDLAWITLDVNAIGVVDLHDAVAFRFGAGLGAGVLLGQMRKTDAICTSDRLNSDCAPDPNGGQMDEKAKVPPVVPVINALVGMQARPSKNIAINLDGGIHSFPYVALGAEFFLW